jgi:FkbM family methyltransferase
MKAIFLLPLEKLLILVCRIFPFLRSFFSRVGITPARFGTRAVRVRIPGRSASVLITGGATNHLSFQLFWRGMNYYEPFTRTVIEMLTPSRELFIDVGANIGLFSLVVAKLNPQLRVVAFEPNPKMFAILSEHKRVNELSNLTAEPLALSNEDGEANLFLNMSDMSASLAPDFQENFNPALRTVPVKIMTLDSYVQRIGVTGSFVLKVDVEGHDEEFLEGAVASIAKFKPDIVIEVLGDFDPSALDQLRSLGYSFYRITDQGLIESDAVTLTKIGDFTFFNYLFTIRPPGELAGVSETIRERARGINLYRTSKFPGHPVHTPTKSTKSPAPQ